MLNSNVNNDVNKKLPFGDRNVVANGTGFLFADNKDRLVFVATETRLSH